MKTAIWWIRRDIRLLDNTALSAARQNAENVIPLFIIDPKLVSSSYASRRRMEFLLGGLRALERSLRDLGSALVIRRGDPLEALHIIVNESGAEGIFAEADLTPYARSRDHRIGQELPLTLTNGITVHLPEQLLKQDGKPYTVFTPFSRTWRSIPFPGRPLPAPERMPPVPTLHSLDIPESHNNLDTTVFPPGEKEALIRLDNFCALKIYHYADTRNRMDLEGTSILSPYIRFGMVSARQAAWSAMEAEGKTENETARRGAETWLNELIWREFYSSVLYHFPHVRGNAFKPDTRNIPWLDDPGGFDAWADGQTGYPVVDAAMRQLSQTGWMHNRARMIVSSFLTKDLLIDWRKGERYFMQHLVDGDPAANNGGWQWAAGTGTDAAPYFRVFNPVLQGQKFDPQGVYVRLWIPELAAVADHFIHNPWKMTLDDQHRCNCVIGKDYPFPIVDHIMARQRVLDTYRTRK
jgi:deoxyribodipyrimidine photo-lyase